MSTSIESFPEDLRQHRACPKAWGLVRAGMTALTSFLAVSLATPVLGQVTSRVSVTTGGTEGNSDSADPSISADGHYVAFNSVASNLVAGDTNGKHDIFVRDRVSGTTTRVSVATGATQGDDRSFNPSISADGRYVVFQSDATNLVAGDTNAQTDVFVHDRLTGTTSRVSVGAGGAQGDSASYCNGRSISASGRYVAFWSWASNLLAGDTNGNLDAFVRDIQTGATSRVSVVTGGAQANGQSREPSISADGRYVSFFSLATNLVTGDTNATWDVFVHDGQTGTTGRVSVATGGVQANDESLYSSISADGRYVAFHSSASNLVVGDTNANVDVFVHDRQTATTSRVSVDSGGGQGDGYSSYPSISDDGRFVTFHSDSSLTSGTGGIDDIFLHDRQTGATSLLSVATGGASGNNDSTRPSISADARFVAFRSDASNLVSGDTNGALDVFVHDRAADGFTSFCDPGVGGVISCPCSNPPSGSNRGCNNSAGTGGAILSASGIAYLSMDSLVFTTSGEKPTATSILLQGTASAPAGIVYGQGVRCAGGALKRLFTKNAVGGSILAPNFGAGDPSVSSRSAAKGDTILAGQSRWYLVYYRDPVVLGGCPGTSTYNATQSGQVAWSP